MRVAATREAFHGVDDQIAESKYISFLQSMNKGKKSLGAREDRRQKSLQEKNYYMHKRLEMTDRVRTNQKDIELGQQDRFDYLIKRQRDRNKLIKEVKLAYREEVD